MQSRLNYIKMSTSM